MLRLEIFMLNELHVHIFSRKSLDLISVFLSMLIKSFIPILLLEGKLIIYLDSSQIFILHFIDY